MEDRWILRYHPETNTIDVVPDWGKIPLDEFEGFEVESTNSTERNGCSDTLREGRVRVSH